MNRFAVIALVVMLAVPGIIGCGRATEDSTTSPPKRAPESSAMSAQTHTSEAAKTAQPTIETVSDADGADATADPAGDRTGVRDAAQQLTENAASDAQTLGEIMGELDQIVENASRTKEAMLELKLSQPAREGVPESREE